MNTVNASCENYPNIVNSLLIRYVRNMNYFVHMKIIKNNSYLVCLVLAFLTIVCLNYPQPYKIGLTTDIWQMVFC